MRALAQDAGTLVVIDPKILVNHPERLSMPGLPNLSRVDAAVYRGGRPQLELGGAESLQKLRIKQVVNLQGGDYEAAVTSGWSDYSQMLLRMEPGEALAAIEAETKALEKIGAQMNHVPLDSLDPITAEEAAALEKILQLLAAATPAAPIYVHCEHGKDRTGLVLALYRIRYGGWSADKAATEMAEMGHSGHLDHFFTGNMDVRRVLALFPMLGPLPPVTVPPNVAKP